ncbi:MAG: putative toxin-antitoxin system toxin component, PIN family [Thermomicrobiales bacterium]|jgi:putative PIN family toxin of toxin-antitoxin system
MDRVVIDANVWVSATLYPASVPDRVIRLAREEAIQSVLSESLIKQVVRTVLGSKLNFDLERAEQTEAEMRQLSELVMPGFRLSVITAKESDNRVLECAVEGRADVIVTGDRKHLLPLGSHEGIPIVAPAEFLQARVAA